MPPEPTEQSLQQRLDALEKEAQQHRDQLAQIEVWKKNVEEDIKKLNRIIGA